MIERQVHFSVHPEKTAEFENFFRGEYRPAMARSAGFISVELLADPSEPGCYQMAIRFADQPSSDAWRASDDHKGLSPRLKELVSGIQASVYEVVA